jgi:hypothetical protein
MSDYKIGRVISVSGDNITIGLIETGKAIGHAHAGVPEDMVIRIPGKSGPASELIVGAPGSFVKIDIPGGMLLCMVTEAHTPDIIVKESAGAGASAADDDNGRVTLIRELPKRRISVITFGTIGAAGEFIPGCSTLPTINKDVYAVLPEELESIYKNYAHGQFSIGTLSQAAGIPATINFDAFFSRHAAILGQSGGGKSWTVASVLQKIMEFPQSTTILFDLHGEYKAAFPDGGAHYIDATDLEFPFWLMNSEELLGMMVERSEIAAPNQAAKFKELVIDAKNTEAHKLGIMNPTVDTPIWFDFEGVIEEFRRLDTEMVEGARGEKKGPLNGQFTRLLMRIDSKLADRRYDLIFKPRAYNNSASMEGLFRKILGEEQSGPKKIVIIDMSPIPFDVRNSVISLLLRGLFDFSYWHKRVIKETYPIIVFCDEAHIYLNDRDASTDAPRLAAERIAKEGRKYGVCLVVVSQRPREVSSTILAQCNTFLCLRITNPDDQSYVKNLLPDSTRGITSMFSTLRRGECILLGDSVIMPTRIQIHEPKHKPESGDTSFVNKWSGAHKELNVNKVIDAWRRQGEE